MKALSARLLVRNFRHLKTDSLWTHCCTSLSKDIHWPKVSIRIVVGLLNSSQRMAFINLDVSVLCDQVRKLKISTDLSCGIGQGRNGNTFFVHFL